MAAPPTFREERRTKRERTRRATNPVCPTLHRATCQQGVFHLATCHQAVSPRATCHPAVPLGGLPSSDLPTNDPPPGDGQTSFQENIDEESEDDVSEDVIDVTVRHEWIASVERARLAVEILGQRLNGLDSDVKNLEENSLEEVNIIRKELDLRKRTELELKESITSLEFRLLDATTTIQTLKNKVVALEEEREVGATASLGQERETVAEAENRRHNPSSKTHPSPMANGSNAGSSRRSGRSPVEGTGAI